MYQATVIIPTYNRAHLLRETLASVFAQRNVELEVIVIDDESSDNTADVAREFPGIRYVRQTRGGPNVARNRAVAMASHDCIAMLDDDDLWVPYKLELELAVLERDPSAAYIFSNFWILRPDGKRSPNGLATWHIPEDKWARLHADPYSFKSPIVAGIPELKTDVIPYHKVDIYADMLEDPFVLPTTAIFRKSKVPANVKFVENDYICGDWEFFARLSRAHPALYLPFETAINRSHEDAVRLTRTPDRIQLAKRQRLVASLWAQDEEFMRTQGDRVLALQASYHATQAKLALRERAYAEVREHSRQAHDLGARGDVALGVLRMLSPIPGALALLRATEAAVRHLRSH